MADGQNLRGALDLRKKALLIAADVDLNETAKLFAFCLLTYLSDPERTAPQGGGAKREAWTETVGAMMCGSQERGSFRGESHHVWKVRQVIANDIPRYQLPYHRVQCPVPKTRGQNVGKPCGRNAGSSWVEYDAETGEATHVGYCSRHLLPEHRTQRQESYQAWVEHGKPVPEANRGGILARHFNTDWAKLYKWADPHREPLPNGKPMTPPKPTLTLIKGGLG